MIDICIQENITSFNFIFQAFEHTLIESNIFRRAFFIALKNQEA